MKNQRDIRSGPLPVSDFDVHATSGNRTVYITRLVRDFKAFYEAESDKKN
jgi:hypothetical protein